VPFGLAARIEAERAAGRPFRLKVWTGASTGPELDGALARADGIEFRLPYNSDPYARERINKGEMEYLDMHLSQVAPVAWQGFLGPLDTAVVEVSGVREDGTLIPSSAVGNNNTWPDRAERIALEVNSSPHAAMEGSAGCGGGRGLGRSRGRDAAPLLLGRQQQDLAGPRRAHRAGGQQLAERGAGGDARHLLRHGPAAEPGADPADQADRPDRRDRL